VKNTTHFEGATPIIPVSEVHDGAEHYVNALGFKMNWRVAQRRR
jgi:hypothetical protein